MTTVGTGAVDVVIPTIGRSSLRTLLESLVAGGAPERVILVDDRRTPDASLTAHVPAGLRGRVQVLRGRAAGPAAARNVGWRAATSEWVAFLDDDVVPPTGWYAALRRDLAHC